MPFETLVGAAHRSAPSPAFQRSGHAVADQTRPRPPDPAHKPPRALPRRAVRPRPRRDTALRALLDAVVAHRGGSIERVGYVLPRQLLDETRVQRVAYPGARVAVRLQLHATPRGLRPGGR